MNRRRDHVKRTLDSAWSQYEKPESKERIDLIRSLGFATHTLDCVFDPESYTTFDDAQLSDMMIESNSNASSIAVVALAPGERASVTATAHPLQNNLDDEQFTNRLHAPIQAGASTHYPTFTDIDLRQTVIEYGRPTIVLPYSDNIPPTCPSAFFHEVTHVAQRIDRPVDRYDTDDAMGFDKIRINDELAAYAVQAVMLDDVFESADMSFDTALTVNAFRMQQLGRDSYTITDNLMDAIAADPLLKSALG